MGDAAAQERIVMLPFMAQGHLIPFLSLAKLIHQRTSLAVTIVTTPLNLNYLHSTISAGKTPSQIKLVALPFNSSDHGLPPDTENTESLSPNQIIKLYHSASVLESPFKALISDFVERDGKPPLCIISDVFMGWASRVAASYGTFHACFSTGGAYGTAAYVSMWQNLPHRFCESDQDFSLPGLPESIRLVKSQLHPYMRSADGKDLWSLFFQKQIELSLASSTGWLCNTAQEIEPLGFEILEKYIKLPVWCVGPLLPEAMLKEPSSSGPGVIGQRTGRVPGLSPEKCLEWLDLHAKRSVVYISFGSQNSISPSQMMELAKGLEDSEKPFIWVIRPPIGFDLKGEFRPEWLPEGFPERMTQKEQGLIIHGWAPQAEILSHRSTGAFLSHCGWNSVLESLSQGVPMIGWPLSGEQGYNTKMLVEETRVCVELTRGVDGVITRELVKRVIELVLDGDGKGKEMKKKAAEMGRSMREAMNEEGGRKGSSLQRLDDFFSTLLSKRNLLSQKM